ncbi:MAG: DnaJ domain-containing protein [Chthonomonadales bacterium]|nr:DnaJ domain-containing protein [Chthonomonadales bacterium]
MPNHYETLGLSPQATAEEIKKRFRELARQWHPDVARSPNAAERFKAINEAYRVLGDAERRASYDSELKLARMRSATTGSPRASSSARTSSTNPRPSKQASDRPSGTSHGARKDAAYEASRTYAIGRLLTDAQAAMARMRLNEAAAICRAVLELDRRNPVAHEILGDISRFRGRPDQALAYYTLAIQMDPVNARLRAKFESLAAEPWREPAERSDRARTGMRSAITLMAALLMVSLLVVILDAAKPTSAGDGWAPWDWNVVNILGLPIAGALAGAFASLTGWLRPARSELMVAPVSARSRPTVPIGAILVMMSVVCFWLAGVMYVFAAASQEALSRSIIIAFGVSAAIVAVFAVFNPLAWLPVVLLGGNLVFPAFVGAWALGDGARR